ncbi:MAG: geranylgeranyl reductase family protein [Methanomassiliicoccales archaeon]|nr:MAG: geranylgeranyl reductase family protein [Methanomassiliicoccales archaeon]
MYDVVIVGAGPAGASTAYVLENSGYKIALLDKEQFPRTKPCAGVIPPKVYSELEIPDNIMERPLEGYRIFSPSGAMVQSSFPTRGLIVRRERFDNFLIKRLKNQPKRIRVSRYEIKKEFVEVGGKGGSFRTNLVVGADGVNSVVRKISGINDCGKNRSSDMAVAMQYEISLSKERVDDMIGNWFEVYYSIPYGYAWISPLKDAVKLGVGGLSPSFKKNCKKNLDEFLKRKDIKEKISDGKIVRTEAHLIPMRGPFDILTADRTILVGDAGGFVFPGTGEGIFYAMKSGRIAAEVIIQAIKEQRFELKFLGTSYTEKLKKNGLTSLRKVDFVERVLSSPEKAEKYLKRLKLFS